MSTVTTPISSLPAVTGTTPAPASNTLGQSEFLQLLTTQLQNQDPLSPMDSSAFVAQLAQFSTVEGITNLGTQLGSLITAQSSANQLSAATLVGKQVLFNSSQIALTQGQPAAFGVTLDNAASDVVASVADGTGAIVGTIDLGAQAAGTVQATWSGLDANGNPLPSGTYTVAVNATPVAGSTVNATTSVSGVVTGIGLGGQATTVNVAGQSIPLTSLVEVGTAPVP